MYKNVNYQIKKFDGLKKIKTEEEKKLFINWQKAYNAADSALFIFNEPKPGQLLQKIIDEKGKNKKKASSTIAEADELLVIGSIELGKTITANSINESVKTPLARVSSTKPATEKKCCPSVFCMSQKLGNSLLERKSPTMLWLCFDLADLRFRDQVKKSLEEISRFSDVKIFLVGLNYDASLFAQNNAEYLQQEAKSKSYGFSIDTEIGLNKLVKKTSQFFFNEQKKAKEKIEEETSLEPAIPAEKQSKSSEHKELQKTSYEGTSEKNEQNQQDASSAGIAGIEQVSQREPVEIMPTFRQQPIAFVVKHLKAIGEFIWCHKFRILLGLGLAALVVLLCMVPGVGQAVGFGFVTVALFKVALATHLSLLSAELIGAIVCGIVAVTAPFWFGQLCKEISAALLKPLDNLIDTAFIWIFGSEKCNEANLQWTAIFGAPLLLITFVPWAVTYTLFMIGKTSVGTQKTLGYQVDEEQFNFFKEDSEVEERDTSVVGINKLYHRREFTQSSTTPSDERETDKNADNEVESEIDSTSEVRDQVKIESSLGEKREKGKEKEEEQVTLENRFKQAYKNN